MKVRELASVLGVSHATVSKWERAQLVPDAESVVAYLQAVGVTGEARERILSLVRGSNDPSWLAAGMPGASQGLAGVLECERTATTIVQWAPLLVPGPCQTRETAYAILSEANETLDPKELDALVDVRAERLKNLTSVRDEQANLGPAEYTALISENALREKPGGARIAADQLRHLLELDYPTVTIQVVRSGGEWHPGLSGPFILYSFADAEPIVHIEHYSSSAFLYNVSDIRMYKAAANTIRRRAMSPEESAAFIADVLNEVENE